MSTVQGAASPHAPRGHQPQPRSATQAPHNNSGRASQRRPRGNRAHNSHNSHTHPNAAASPAKSPPKGHPAHAHGAVLSAGEVQSPTPPRTAKKHPQSQSSAERAFSPNGASSSWTGADAVRNSASATPAKNQGAYAGPTFHASPAPSALPIPKFLSRSVPAKTQPGPPTPPLEESSDSAGSPSPSPSPSRAPIAVPISARDSPLDMLFRADKAERARNIAGGPVSMYSGSPRPQHHKQDSYGSLNTVFPIELDGETKHAHLSSPPVASPTVHRSVTDPSGMPLLKDVSQPNDGNDIMQDLFSRLSMSQKKSTTATPPRPEQQAHSDFQAHHKTPSPSAYHNASNSSTPTAGAAAQESSELFYGNRNLSPMFKATKGDSAKRNSGLRTEVTADSPAAPQGEFQDFPSIPTAKKMDQNTFSRGHQKDGGQVPARPRRGSAPYVQPYREMPNNRQTKTPGRYSYQSRADHYPQRSNTNGFSPRHGQQTANPASASVKKPCTTMMSFVPASVAAKQHKASIPPTAAAPPPSHPPPSTNTSTSDTLALEQDLKRLLNLNLAGDTSSAR